jgi:hypothetical protein
MAQIAHVAMTDFLKVELTGEAQGNEYFRFSVFELINGSWFYLDSAMTTLPVNSSEGRIHKMLKTLAGAYTEALTLNRNCDIAKLTQELSTLDASKL